MAGKDISIHPRNYYSRGDKVNTMKSPNKDIIKAKIARMKEHLDRHPADGATRNHVAKKEALL
jgi:ribosomal protein S15P/S13E